MPAALSMLSVYCLLAAPLQRNSTVVISPNERLVGAVNQDADTISLWRWQTDQPVTQIQVDEEPRNIAFSGDGKWAYVTAQRAQTLCIIDLQLSRCVRRIPVGGQPVGIVLSATGTEAYVTQFAGDYFGTEYAPGALAIIDLQQARVRSRLPLAARPFAIARSANGQRLWVSHYLGIQRRGLITEIDLQQEAVRRTIPLVEDPDVGGGRGGIFTAVASLDIHPRFPRALVAGMHANQKRGPTQSGQPLSHKTTVQAAVAILDLDNGSELPEARIVSSFSGQAVAVPAAVAFLPGGKHFIDIYFASHDLKVIRYNERGLVAERALLELPHGPDGIALTSDGKHGFVNARWDRQIAHLDLSDVRRPRILAKISKHDETWSSQRILGARIFHNSRDPRMTPNRWLSCGVCHLDGGLQSDHLVWEFSLTQKPSSPRLVNTKSLAVTAASGPPFLIQGSYHSVQQEDLFVRSFLGGSGFVLSDKGERPNISASISTEMDAVAEFVLSLTPRPNPHLSEGTPRKAIRAAATRGRRLFHSAKVGCSRCHAGPWMTISGRKPTRLVDVGTGIRADVPSLLNVWETAPYLHDGRATTLREVVTLHNPHDQHGRTSHLNASELTDLVRFLQAPH
ncbi:MAG: hypothetical protein VX346_26095 [Planctomycetota bacterium]|nr:hypothetical protein [Planctomycetota bacterium]